MTKAIIFDKDGTLLKLDSVWYKIVHHVLDELFKTYQIDKKRRIEFFKVIGMKEADIESTSLLACQTNYYIAEAWYSLLKHEHVHKTEFIEEVCRLFKQYSTSDDLVFTEVEGTKQTLRKLKADGYIIGVITSDDVDAALHSLKMTGLAEYIDFLGADNGVNRPKPESDFYHIFKEKFALNDEDVLMVGDTQTDVRFARNCNIRIAGVLSGASRKEDLYGTVDFIIDSVKNITEIL